MKNKVAFLVVWLFSLLGNSAFSQGCSQCRLTMEQATEAGEASFGSNINTGILMLMTLPYILLMLLFRKPILRFFKKLISRQKAITHN